MLKIDDKYDKIIKCAIRNHNKYEIQKEIDEQELLYAKIIRDADKIDILYETAEGLVLGENERKEIENSSISSEYFEQFKRKKTIIKDGNETYLDKLILTVALVFDINFEYSNYMIIKEKYISKILNKYDIKQIDEKRKMKEIKQILTDFM